MRNIVILGAGTAGTIMANRLARQNKASLAAGSRDEKPEARTLYPV